MLVYVAMARMRFAMEIVPYLVISSMTLEASIVDGTEYNNYAEGTFRIKLTIHLSKSKKHFNISVSSHQ